MVYSYASWDSSDISGKFGVNHEWIVVFTVLYVKMADRWIYTRTFARQWDIFLLKPEDYPIEMYLKIVVVPYPNIRSEIICNGNPRKLNMEV